MLDNETNSSAPTSGSNNKSMNSNSKWCYDCRTHGYALKEVRIMQETFRSMLWSLKMSYEQLQQANEAKKAFIRYVFHEVTNSYK